MFLKESLIILLFTSCVYSGSVQENRTERLNEHRKVTEVKGIQDKFVTKASNGNLYIQNARVYSGSKHNQTGRVSVDAGTETRKVILKNVKVSSRHSVNNHSSVNSVLSVKTKNNSKVIVKNSTINAVGTNLNSSSNTKKNCVGALCIQTDTRSEVIISNTNVSTSGSNMSLTTGNNTKKNCAGALCIQADDSSVNILNTSVSSTGINDFSIIKR